MGQFKDSKDRTWTFAITVMTLRRVKTDTADKENGFDGINLTLGETLVTISEDVFLLADVLYSLCRNEIKERGLSEEDFTDGLADGEVMQSAMECLTAELINFTPPAKRQAVQKAVDAQATWMEKTIALQNEVLGGKSLDEKFEKSKVKLLEQIDQQFGTPLIPTPESSGLTPAP